MIRLALPILACVAVSPASELYSWHSFDAFVRVNERVELVLHSRIRSRDSFSDLQQLRAGPVARIRVRKRLIWYSGYYFQPGDNGDKIWGTGHRVFSGIEVPVERGRVGLTLRVAAERNFHSLDEDYNRYRTYTRLTWRRRLTPFLQNEWFTVNSGFQSLRNGAGVQFSLGSRTTVEVGYLYDFRRQVWGGARQAIFTSVRLRPESGKH